jgi:hypothetical protein
MRGKERCDSREVQKMSQQELTLEETRNREVTLAIIFFREF